MSEPTAPEGRSTPIPRGETQQEVRDATTYPKHRRAEASTSSRRGPDRGRDRAEPGRYSPPERASEVADDARGRIVDGRSRSDGAAANACTNARAFLFAIAERGLIVSHV